MLRTWAVALLVLGSMAWAADQVIYEFTPEMIAAAWQPYLDLEEQAFLGAGSVTLKDGKAVVGLTFGEPWGGGVISPWLFLDTSKNPVIILLGVEPEKMWTLKAHVRSLVYIPDEKGFKVEGWGTYLIGDNNQTGNVEIVLNEGLRQFAPIGVIRGIRDNPIIAIRLWFWGVGGSVSVNGIRIVYRTSE